MRVLVTGKSSYIGRSFLAFLKQRHADWQADCISVRDDAWEQMDFSRYDAVLHLAAVVHRRAGAEEYERVNVELTRRLAAKAKREGAAQFVFLSSLAVYGSRDGRIRAGSPEPESAYGRSKWRAEQELGAMEDGRFAVFAVRAPMVYGKDCPGNFRKLLGLAGSCCVFPRIRSRRSMVYVENLCAYLCLVLERRARGTGHPVNEEPVCVSELYVRMRSGMGKRTLLLPVPEGLLRCAAVVFPPCGKVFGSLCLEEGEEVIAKQEYQQVDFPESVRRSLSEKEGKHRGGLAGRKLFRK